MKNVRVKICCIADEAEAQTAVALGASAVGLVSDMPSGPGVISEETIHKIARSIPPGVSSFLLTCLQQSTSIIEQHRRCRTSTIQICDTLENQAYDEIRETLHGISLVQVIHVNGPDSVRDAESIAPMVDAILLDSGNQSLAVKELGGTGRVHDWTLSSEIVRSVGVPVYLAGGLHVDNIREAIETVRPFGVDLCSGVRTQRRLDEEKLQRFMSAVRADR